MVADALSRLPSKEQLYDDEDFDVPLIQSVACNMSTQALPDPQSFRDAQDRDEGLQNWIQNHKNSTKFKPRIVPCFDANVQVWADASHHPPKILVPTIYKREVFDHYHNLSHAGGKGSYKLIHQTHYWPNMQKEIAQFCRSCVDCQRSKIKKHTKSFLQALPSPSGRFDHIHIDIVSGFKTSRYGNSMLLTIMDRWTGWPEAVPISTSNAQECAKILINHWIARFGAPKTITSDRGTSFLSAVWSELSELIGIHNIRTTSYHPQANGKIERFHKTLKNSLRARLCENINWEHQLPWCLLGIRCTPNSDTGLSPATLVYGQTLSIPGEMIVGSRSDEAVGNKASYTKELALAMSKQKFHGPLWHKKRNYVEEYESKDMRKSEWVLVRSDGINPALAPRYKGPFKVMERSNKYFKLDMINKLENVSVDRLIPFYSP